MKIIRKTRLPHLPLEDPLPSLTEIPKKNKWLGKSIEQRILVQDLEHINNAIAELRQYQETILKKAKVPLPPAYVDFKHHLPIILDSPENLHFFEEELAGVNQALVDLETQPFSPVKRVQDIPPLPPKQNNCSIRNYLIKTSIEESPAQQSITSQLSPEEKVRASKPKQNPKSLLDRLRYGVIELQDKWAEVKGRLNDIDYPNLEVKRQLSKLDLELKKFKEISTPFKTSLLTPKAQERVRSKIKQIKRRINKERTILPELLVIENNLKNLRNYKLQKVRVLKSISAFGKSTILSSRQQNRIHQATKEFISNISNKDLKNYELLNLDKYLHDWLNYKMPKPLVSRIVPATMGHSQDLSEKKAALQKEIEKKKRIIKDQPIRITPEIALINKKLDETNKAALQKNKVTIRLPRIESSESLRIRKEFRAIQNILARSFKDPSLLLGKFRKRNRQLTEVERRAKDEVIRIMRRIEGDNPLPQNELLQIEQSLRILDTIPLEAGKLVRRSSGKVEPSRVEQAFLQQELDQIIPMRIDRPVIIAKKTSELLEIESKLARIYAS